MAIMNTLNVCLGHKEPPKDFHDYVDLFLTPVLSFNGEKIAYIPDSIYGEHGHTLSEYGQLIWLSKNIDKLLPNYEYVRIFHYRRFTSKESYNVAIKAENNEWTFTIKECSIPLLADNFIRLSQFELFNTLINFENGVIGQYAGAHILEDFLNFTNFLVEKNIIDTKLALEFLSQKKFIPACNTGVFKIENFKKQFQILDQASGFLHSANFKIREGYQRRSMGFLLERLHSFLIMKWILGGVSPENHGINYLISDTPFMNRTVERIN